MSDHELREDLFGDSDGEAPQRSVSSAGSVANGGPPEDGNMKESAQLAEAGDENGGDLVRDLLISRVTLADGNGVRRR
jgi:hypothetical protein